MADAPLIDRWLTLNRLSAQINRAIEQTLSARHGLCAGAYEIMDVLRDAPEWTRLGELSGGVSRSQPQTSRLVTQLVDAGYLERTPSPGDGRSTQVRLTPAGRRIFQAATVTVEELLRTLTEENLDAGALFLVPDPTG
ncbi:MarR family winged helix-turn-helix transcriptional regulator [Streptomyces sp. WM6386]|uniref:MarR family winged helix-turn-helix transcriptional regulator n=1 Tax=Streptomyces sp. WM6386 TaxID=1415558 RepID=UPI0006984DBF|nr:MarR family transcriptional regulator [Streptomyces sp. WM6386]